MFIKNITIAFMSPTGGTEIIVHTIYDAFASKNIFPSMYDFIKPKSREVVHQFKDDELVIFVCPTYFGRMPKALDNFPGLRGRKAKAFIVSTYGNRLTDDQPREIADMLTKKGFIVCGYAEVVVRHAIDKDLGANRPNAGDLQMLQDNILDFLVSLKQDEIAVPYTFDKTTAYVERHETFGVPTILTKRELCSTCGICAKFCPMGIIDKTTFEVPDDKRDMCMGCNSCVCHCPHNIRGITDEAKQKAKEFFDPVKTIHLAPKANIFHINRI